MITNAETGRIACDTLAATYASTNTTNVMRLEEVFGIAKKSNTQSMSQWNAYIKSLVSQLRGIGVIIDTSKVANRILNGLDSVHDPMKYTLQACSRALTVEIVTEYLLAWERQNQSASQFSVPAPYTITPMAAQNNTHHGHMATALSTTSAPPPSNTPQSNSQSICCFNCCDHHQSLPGAVRSPSSSSRFSPYPTPLLCHACGKYGHSHSRCWSRFPHLRPSWSNPNPDTSSHLS